MPFKGKGYESLKDMIDNRNLTKKHIVIKIDIEGAEWPGFRALPIAYLEYIDQIVLEIHNPGRNMRHQPYWGNLEIIKAMNEHFVSVWYHTNAGTCFPADQMRRNVRKLPGFAVEAALVNKKLIKLKS